MRVRTQDLEVLHGTASAKLVSSMCINMNDRATTLCEAAAESMPEADKMPTSEMCQWAISTAYSLGQTLHVGGKTHKCIVPYMAPGDHGSHNSALVEENNEVTLVATKGIAADERITTYYEDKTLEDGFVTLGFAAKDMAPLSIWMKFVHHIKQVKDYHDFNEAGSDMAGLQVQLVQAKGCHKDWPTAGGGIDWRMLENLLQCSRLLEIDSTALKPLLRILESDEEVTPQTNVTILNWRNEVGALQRLEGLFEVLLDAHTRSDQDAEYIAEQLGSPGAVFLMEYRGAERQFFEHHMREVAHRLMNVPMDKTEDTSMYARSGRHQQEEAFGQPVNEL